MTAVGVFEHTRSSSYGFELAYRRLRHDERDQARALLDGRVAGGDQPGARASLYGELADWLAEGGDAELADTVRRRS